VPLHTMVAKGWRFDLRDEGDMGEG
jgi:hypothetical protein